MDVRRLPAVVTTGLTVVGAAAAIGAAAAHVATYGPQEWAPALSNLALALFPVMFLVFAPAILILSLARVRFDSVLLTLPRWSIVAGIVLVAYIGADFFAMGRTLQARGPLDGWGLMHQARIFTGHEIFFFGLTATIAYQLDRARRGALDLNAAPRDDALERNPFPAPLSRSLTLQTLLSPDECARRLLLPAKRSALALVGRYGLRGQATAEGFRLELGGSRSSMVYAVGRIDGASTPTFIRVLLTFKRWPLVILLLSALLLPVWALIIGGFGFPFSWQGVTLVLLIAVGGNFVFALAQMRSLLGQIKTAIEATEVAAG